MENNALINYQYLERGDNLIVAIHGLFGSSHDFLFLKNNFKSYSLLLIDLPGHGKSPISQSDTFLYVATELESFISTFKKKRTHLLGYSMGGRLAMQMVLLFPNQFSSLILESAHPGLSASDSTLRLKADSALSDTLSDLSSFFKFWYSQPLFYNYNPSISYQNSILKKEKHSTLSYQLAMQQFSIGHQCDLRGIFNLSLPITYIYGQFDTKYKELATTLPLKKESIHQISNSGHNCHAENQTDYIAAIKTHLRRLS